MRATICPTILAEEPHGFRVQLQRVTPFAGRLHIDLMDGVFAAPRSIAIGQVYWPANVAVDIHLMYQRPMDRLQALLAIRPQMVIVHAEAQGEFLPFASELHRHGIEVGVAVLPPTQIHTIAPAIDVIDHVLIFSGKLGHFGGIADLQLLRKVAFIRELKPSVEIGWDGGVNAGNIRQLVSHGIDVVNVGGYIQHAINPARAYATLESLT